MKTKKEPALQKTKQRLKMFKIQCLVTACFSASVLIADVMPKQTYISPVDNLDSEHFVVAHAGGGLKDENGRLQRYLNCVEGFEHYYDLGTRLFEYDLAFSSEGRLIATHKYEYLDGYSKKNRISYHHYSNLLIADKYKGMTEDRLLSIICNYPDARFIIDTKEEDALEVYKRLIKRAGQVGIDISSSIIPFVFSEEALDFYEEKGIFEEYMFSNYKEYYSTSELVRIINEHDKIKYIHLFPVDMVRIDVDQLNECGVRVFAHMDKGTPLKFPLRYGCTGVFSDNISERDFRTNYLSLVKQKNSARQYAKSPTLATKKSQIYSQKPKILYNAK